MGWVPRKHPLVHLTTVCKRLLLLRRTTNQYTQVYYPSTNYTTMGGAGYGSFPTALN